MRKWIFGILIFLSLIFILLFLWNWQNSPTNELVRLEKGSQFDTVVFKTPQKETKQEIPQKESKQETSQNKIDQELPQGTFSYELYFAEYGGRVENMKCEVTIKGNKITIKQIEEPDLSNEKDFFQGFILKHKSGKWILTNDENDVNSDEIGGCTGVPIIEFDKKIIEWC